MRHRRTIDNAERVRHRIACGGSGHVIRGAPRARLWPIAARRPQCALRKIRPRYRRRRPTLACAPPRRARALERRDGAPDGPHLARERIDGAPRSVVRGIYARRRSRLNTARTSSDRASCARSSVRLCVPVRSRGVGWVDECGCKRLRLSRACPASHFALLFSRASTRPERCL
jgi:hypothetical protein